MSKSYNNIKSLKSQLAKDIRDSMEGGVSKSIQAQMNIAIKETVYREYSPKRYDRRRTTNGGLQSDEAFKNVATRKGNNTRLEIENIAKANLSYERIEDSASQYLTPLIVYGHGGRGGKYSWGDEYPYSYIEPRNFIKETRDRLRRQSNHRIGLWIALEDKGYEVDPFN